MSAAVARSSVFLITSSLLVLGLCLLASFRLGFADDLPTLVAIQGARVLLGAAVGACLAGSADLRFELGRERALSELRLFALSVGAGGGGFLAAEVFSGGLIAFALGALAGAGALLAVVHVLDRPSRAAGAALLVFIPALVGIAAVAGSYAGARRDAVRGVVAWLLGDLSGATPLAAGLVASLAILLLLAAVRPLSGAGDRSRLSPLSLVLLGLAVGSAGPLAFVGGLTARTVRALTPGVSAAHRLGLAALAGAATVCAVDAVPRLLVGGYDFPFNVPAGMLAVPVFIGWNRRRLQREAGPLPRPLEVLELATLAALTLLGIVVVLFFTRVIAEAT